MEQRSLSTQKNPLRGGDKSSSPSAQPSATPFPPRVAPSPLDLAPALIMRPTIHVLSPLGPLDHVLFPLPGSCSASLPPLVSTYALLLALPLRRYRSASPVFPRPDACLSSCNSFPHLLLRPPFACRYPPPNRLPRGRTGVACDLEEDMAGACRARAMCARILGADKGSWASGVWRWTRGEQKPPEEEGVVEEGR